MAFDVRRLDIYRKIPKDLTQPTMTGAVISVCCCCFIAILFFSELFSYISTDITSELFVDNPSDTDKILVRLNISLPRLACSECNFRRGGLGKAHETLLGLDIQDDMGRHEVGFVENIVQVPLHGSIGCRFEGKFYINKVPGNFHVSTHSATEQPESIDMAHVIHEVSFGAEMPESTKGSFNSLKGKDRKDAKAIESHDYVMRIVPTIYEDIYGNKIETYQYTYAYKSSVTFSHIGRIMPAIWFRYDMTPITVKYTEKRQPLYSFLTTVCAIVGGTFTVAGIIDSLLFTASSVFQKFEIGKLS